MMNNIKFDVPYNGDSKIIQFYIDNQERIEMVYGRADDGYPQGRKTNNGVQISLDDIYLQNKKLNENGIKFNYLLNGTSHGNQEYDKEYRKRFINHVKNLRNNGIKIVTIGNLFLLEAVISEVQGIDIAVSVLLEIDSLVKVKTVCQLGVKYIFLSKVLLKNFNALKNINNYISKNYPDIKLFLLANDPCLNQCLYTNYHNETLSLLTGNNKNCNSFCRLQCTKKFSSNTGAIISASFIRPEDLDIYSGYGYNYIKLCDRKQTTNWLKRMFNAYIAKDYNGELSDIMAPWSKYNGKYPQIKEISINNFIKDGLASYRDYIRFTPKINNKHLEGYLKFWIYNKSNGCINEDCDVCGYCQSLANKYITETEDYKILQTNLVNAIKSNFL